MSISFNEVSASIYTPGTFIEISNERAVQGTPEQPHVTLIIGQRLSTGTKAALELHRVLGEKTQESYSGIGSPLAAMVKGAKDIDPQTETWAIGVDAEALAAEATGTFAITGTAVAAGSLPLYVGGRRYEVPISVGTTGAQAVTAAVALINADPRRYATATAVTTDLILEARWGGTTGNDIDLRVAHRDGESVPAGLAVAVTAMAGGTLVPDMTDVVAALGDKQFHTVITMFNDDASMDILEAFLETRWGAMVQKEGHLFAAIADTYANSTTASNARNSRASCLVGIQQSPTPQWEAAARLGAECAKQAQLDPARPLQTLRVRGIEAPQVSDRWDRPTRDLALHDGLATVTYGETDGVCAIERMVTTYQLSAAGVADTSYLDLVTLRTLAFIRYSLRARIALKFPRHKLANDGTNYSQGQAVVTPLTIRGEIVALFREWESDGLVEDFDQFAEELIVERSGSDPNRIDVRMGPNLINAFRVFAAQIQFLQ